MPFGRNSETLTILLKGKDKFSKVFRKAKTEVGGLKGALGKIGIAAGAAGAAVAGMAAAVGVKAVKAASRFESQMANVATLVDTSKESMGAMREEILGMSERVPVAMDDLTSALYQVRSAGVDASDAMSVLESSAKLGVAGLGSTEEATNLLTSAFNNFTKQGLSAEEMADILFKTVKAGKTTISELSQSFGKVAPVAGQMGIRFEELQAATAAVTTTGQSASEAQSGLRGMMTALIKPSEDMADLFDRLGVDSGKELIKTSGGLVEAFKKLWEETGDNEQMLGEAVGRVEALNTALALVSKKGGAANVFQEAQKNMKSDTNDLNEAFKKQKETMEASWRLIKNQLNQVMIKLGSTILPEVATVMKEDVVPALEGLSDWVKNNKESIRNFFDMIFHPTEAFEESWIGRMMERGTREIIGAPPPATTIPPLEGQLEQFETGGGGRKFNFDFKGAIIENKERLIQEIIDAINREAEQRYMGGRS